MLISVVICTYNRAALLATVLETVCLQTMAHDDYEVIVVDNHSTDDTPSVCKRFSERQPNLRIVVELQQGLSHARNRGWQEAKGDYVAYIDDDCKAPQEWLVVAGDIIKCTAPDVFGGPYFAFYQTPKPVWFHDRYGGWQPADQAMAITPTALHGGNLFLRRALLVQANGFLPRLGMQGGKIGYGEETELLLRLQASDPETTFYYDPRLFVYHLVRPEKMTIRWNIRARFIQGRAIYQVQALYRQKSGQRDTRLRVQKTLLFIWRMTLGILFRNRTQYPYYQNYLYECILPRISILGNLYEYSKVKRSLPRPENG